MWVTVSGSLTEVSCRRAKAEGPMAVTGRPSRRGGMRTSVVPPLKPVIFTAVPSFMVRTMKSAGLAAAGRSRVAQAESKVSTIAAANAEPLFVSMFVSFAVFCAAPRARMRY